MSEKLPNYKVLIIDDDPIAQMLMKRHLEIAGFQGKIDIAENGQSGFDILKDSQDDYTVILDYEMPILNGLGLLRKMAHHNMNHRVFMLSSSILPEHSAECLAHPFVVDYFIKPIDQSKTSQIIDGYKQAI